MIKKNLVLIGFVVLAISSAATAAPVALVPELPQDVHDLNGLARVAHHLGLLPVDSVDTASTY